MLLQVSDDFDLRKIAGSGQCFRWNSTANGYRVIFKDKCLYIRHAAGGLELDCPKEELSLWMVYFDLSQSYADIRNRIDPTQDPFMMRAAEYSRGIRILRQDSWETMISFILSQNRSIPIIQQSIELLCSAAGEKRLDSHGKEYYAFPKPEALAKLQEDEYAACKLGYRWKYVRTCAQGVLEGRISLPVLEAMDEHTAHEALMRIYGIGSKVAGCINLFGFHHLDAFPVDVWIRRVLDNEYPNGYPRERYEPFNGVYQQFMFFYYRSVYQGGKG